uniref:CCHC-type domain-containing protein n=1 Tax=Amphimedon queenslandica TaxID=400682 RepID=A0A1X7UV92_AMPQE
MFITVVQVTRSKLQHKTRGTKKQSEAEKCCGCQKSGHYHINCRYKDARCFKCGNIGHISTAWHSTKRGVDRQKVLENDRGSSEAEYTVFGGEESEPVKRAMLKVNINKATVLMEVGAGAAVTIIPKVICKLKLKKSSQYT